jgi:ribosomal protein S18 acetylase RimI-like enzyme
MFVDSDIVLKQLDASCWQEFRNLLAEAGWLESDAPEAAVKGMLTGAAAVGIEIKGKGLAAVGRAISDGCSDGYIQDVFVLPSCRGMGLGRKVVEALTEILKTKGCDWIGLIATPGNEGFYKSMGFEVMDGYTPMLHNIKR